MNYSYYLEQFRDLQINKDQLFDLVPRNVQLIRPVLFDRFHIIHALRCLQNYHLTQQEFIDWVNVLWLKDTWFSFTENEGECIASIMNELEEFEDQETELAEEDIKKYIFALTNNLDVNELN